MLRTTWKELLVNQTKTSMQVVTMDPRVTLCPMQESTDESHLQRGMKHDRPCEYHPELHSMLVSQF